MPQEEDEASTTDLREEEKQRVRKIEIQIQGQLLSRRDTRSKEDRSRVRVRVSGLPAQPEAGAEDDEGHPEERHRLETTANGGGGTDGNTITNSHSSPRARGREERGRREESGDRVRQADRGHRSRGRQMRESSDSPDRGCGRCGRERAEIAPWRARLERD